MKKLILFALSLLVFLSCENDQNEINKITKAKAISATMTGKDVCIDYRDSGLIVLTMEAKVLNQFRVNVADPFYEAAKGLKVLFYNKAGKQVSKLSAEYGLYYERAQKVEVRYKVVVVNEEGQRMETEKLFWRQNDSIRSAGQVILWEKGKKIIGNNLVASEDFSHMELFDISAIIPINETKK